MKIVPFSSITPLVKVRCVSNQSIARCNKTITKLMDANIREKIFVK